MPERVRVRKCDAGAAPQRRRSSGAVGWHRAGGKLAGSLQQRAVQASACAGSAGPCNQGAALLHAWHGWHFCGRGATGPARLAHWACHDAASSRWWRRRLPRVMESGRCAIAQHRCTERSPRAFAEMEVLAQGGTAIWIRAGRASQHQAMHAGNCRLGVNKCGSWPAPSLGCKHCARSLSAAPQVRYGVGAGGWYAAMCAGWPEVTGRHRIIHICCSYMRRAMVRDSCASDSVRGLPGECKM